MERLNAKGQENNWILSNSNVNINECIVNQWSYVNFKTVKIKNTTPQDNTNNNKYNSKIKFKREVLLVLLTKRSSVIPICVVIFYIC